MTFKGSVGTPLQTSCLPCAQPSDSAGGASCSDQSFAEHFQPVLRRKRATPLAGGTRGLLQPIPWVRATSSWVRSSPSSWAVLRTVCKEEGPELPIRGRGRAGSCPTNQHEHAQGRSFWPDLLMTFVVCVPQAARACLPGLDLCFLVHTRAHSSQPLPCVYTGFLK